MGTVGKKYYYEHKKEILSEEFWTEKHLRTIDLNFAVSKAREKEGEKKKSYPYAG